MSAAAYVEANRGPLRNVSIKKKEAEFTAANTMRKGLNMRLVVQGDRECLSCTRVFLSPDLVNQKCCDYCRSQNKENL